MSHSITFLQRLRLLLPMLFITVSAFTSLSATVETQVDDIRYSINTISGEATVTGLTDPNKANLVIPDFVEYNGTKFPVTTIRKRAFWCHFGITGSVTIGNSVTTIEDSAFYSCWNLSGKLTIGNSVTTIGDMAFTCCQFTDTLTIPNSVTTIGTNAFSGCKGLMGLTLGSSIREIKENAFYGCSGLTGTLAIPNSVWAIGKGAFSECSGLTGLTLGDSICYIEENAFFECSGLTGTLTIPNSVRTIGKGAFSECSGLTGLTLGSSIREIKENAFYGCSGLTGSLTIPASVSHIGNYAFNGCSGLTGTLTIRGGKNYIGHYAFSDCNRLDSLIIANAPFPVTAFHNCNSLTYIKLPSSLETISGGTFKDCPNLKTVIAPTIVPPKIVSTIDFGEVFDTYAKNNAKLIVLYENVIEYFRESQEWMDFKYICTHEENSTVAFNVDCLTYRINIKNHEASIIGNTPNQKSKVEIPDSVNYNSVNYPITTIKHIGEHGNGVQHPRLLNLKIGNSVTVIEDHAFDCPNLRFVSFGNSVRKIGQGAFGNANLYTLELPASLDSIGEYAFYGAFALHSNVTIKCEAINPPQIYEDHHTLTPNHKLEAFSPAQRYGNSYNNISPANLIIPKQSEDAYANAYEWCEFRKRSTYDTSANETTISDIASPVSVWANENGDIMVNGDYASMKVYDLGGREVRHTSLPKGIYIVRVDGTAHKIAVR